MLLQELLREEHISSRISPAPRSIQRELGCGMSLLIQPEDIEQVRECIEKHHAEYHDIAALPCQINTTASMTILKICFMLLFRPLP